MKLLRPKVLREINTPENFARLDIQPLERGVGNTLGGLFESYFLNNFKGLCPCAFKFSNSKLDDNFSDINEVDEDIIQVIENIKKISVHRKDTEKDEFILSVEVSGKKKVCLKDLTFDSEEIEILNPDTVIFNADAKKKFKFELLLKYSNGYRFSEDFKEEADYKKDFFYFDVGFSPLENIDYRVDNARVGQSINFDLLDMGFTVKEGYDPIELYKEAIEALRIEFSSISDSIPDEISPISIETTHSNDFNPNLSISINDLELSIRCRNCLKQINVETLSDLSEVSTAQLMTINNFGKKSLDELRDVLQSFGLTLKEE